MHFLNPEPINSSVKTNFKYYKLRFFILHLMTALVSIHQKHLLVMAEKKEISEQQSDNEATGSTSS